MPPAEESVWWRGKRGFQVGFFPYECVQVIGDKVPQALHPAPLQVTTNRCPPSSPLQRRAAAPTKPVLRKHGKLIAFFSTAVSEGIWCHASQALVELQYVLVQSSLVIVTGGDTHLRNQEMTANTTIIIDLHCHVGNRSDSST
ncbi:SH3 domain [Trinorchestia longiramus]|nr:SH3 domain [Trinorchestia longiramus]